MNMNGFLFFIEKIVELGYFPSENRFKFWLDSILGNIEFRDKRVLDIGGGIGLLSFYSAVMGAKKVICLEPELDGSSSDLINDFDRINRELNLDNINFVQLKFQDFLVEYDFDVVISYNSINHLNENACVKLKYDYDAQEEYRKYFRKLNSITNRNAKLIICDCSNKNFFPAIGVKNPFAKSIDWKKHQSPYVWRRLLIDSGFMVEKIKWSSPNRFNKLGEYLLGNKYLSYFINSHFCIYATKIK